MVRRELSKVILLLELLEPLELLPEFCAPNTRPAMAVALELELELDELELELELLLIFSRAKFPW
jgi:hypothetical protein